MSKPASAQGDPFFVLNEEIPDQYQGYVLHKGNEQNMGIIFEMFLPSLKKIWINNAEPVKKKKKTNPKKKNSKSITSIRYFFRNV